MSPKDDPTSIGAILIAMSAVTPQQLEQALEEKDRASIDVLVGKIMVANGFCTIEQLEVALSAQSGLRSKKSSDRAIAAVDLAHRSHDAVVSMASRLRKTSAGAVRRVSGVGHQAVAVGDATPAAGMLAKKPE
jgi:hypothetical protein